MRIRNVVIRWQEEQQLIRCRQQGRTGHGGRGVARHRFQDLCEYGCATGQPCGVQLAKRRIHQKTMLGISDAHQVRTKLRSPFQRACKQAAPVDQRYELLGVGLAAHRPQAGAEAAAEHVRHNLVRHRISFRLRMRCRRNAPPYWAAFRRARLPGQPRICWSADISGRLRSMAVATMNRSAGSR